MSRVTAGPFWGPPASRVLPVAVEGHDAGISETLHEFAAAVEQLVTEPCLGFLSLCSNGEAHSFVDGVRDWEVKHIS